MNGLVVTITLPPNTGDAGRWDGALGAIVRAVDMLHGSLTVGPDIVDVEIVDDLETVMRYANAQPRAVIRALAETFGDEYVANAIGAPIWAAEVTAYAGSDQVPTSLQLKVTDGTRTTPPLTGAHLLVVHPRPYT